MMSHSKRAHRRFSALAILTLGLVSALAAVQSANAEPPSGYFYLQSSVQDSSHSFGGVMDVFDGTGMVTGFVQLNAPSESPSQFWKELRPATSDGDTFLLQNKATGQCLADESGNSGNVTIRPCGDLTAHWQKILDPRGFRFRRTTPILGPFKDVQVCFARNWEDQRTVVIFTCYDDNLVGGVFWDETKEPLGTVSGGITVVPPPLVPPDKPANCQVPTNTASCGGLEISCAPFSASDKMVVASGNIGVKVIDVQPNIGLILGSYLNEGSAAISVCATKGGLSACGDSIDVTFGHTVCSGGSIGHLCPRGQIHCGAGCAPPTPECFLK